MVAGFEARDGFIRASGVSRKMMKKFETKKDFANNILWFISSQPYFIILYLYNFSDKIYQDAQHQDGQASHQVLIWWEPCHHGW